VEAVKPAIGPAPFWPHSPPCTHHMNDSCDTTAGTLPRRFVNKNFLGLHKILKKHDKKLPDLACRQFYIAQLHKEPWLAGTFSDILVRLSGLFSMLRGDGSGVKNEDASQVHSPHTFSHVYTTNASLMGAG
jgi:SPX domain protein involved in polyphosphate accumulation